MDQCVVFSCQNPEKPIPVASFALDRAGVGYLGYGRHYMNRPDAFAIDPLHLPLSAEDLKIPRHKDGTYGVLSDAGPDAWGVKLTSSLFRKQKRPLPATPIDWLLQSWHYGSGCLGFAPNAQTPPHPGVKPAPVAALDKRALSAIESLTSDDETELDDEIISLINPGVSLGGVRPKTVVMHEGMEHIAKFSRLDDKFNVPAAEYATMLLAHRARIDVPEFELIPVADRPVLLVCRFDRTSEGRRIHYMSAKTLVNIDTLSPDGREYKTKYSYAGIAESMRTLNPQAVEDSHQLFRRMVFNILVGNVDDHMRNHALLMRKPGQFVLSPAFDIVPHLEATAAPQSIGVGAFGTASTMKNALSQCGRFFLTFNEATDIILQVKEVVSTWRNVFREEAGMSARDIHILEACFTAAEEAENVSVAITGSNRTI